MRLKESLVLRGSFIRVLGRSSRPFSSRDFHIEPQRVFGSYVVTLCLLRTVRELPAG